LAERERWALWLPVGLGAGIAIYFALPFEPGWPWAALAVLLGIAAMFGVAGTHNAAWRIALSAMAVIAFGFACAKVRTELVAAPVIAQKVGPLGVDGRIETIELREKGARIVLGDLQLQRLAPAGTPARIRVTLRVDSSEFHPGSWVHLTAVLMPPPGPAAPGDYDFGRYAYYQRLGAVGYVYGHARPIKPLRAETWTESWSAGLERLRNKVTARIRAVLPGGGGALAAALITGERSGIDPADAEAYRDSGLTHVLSISGLHLALAGGLFFWILRAALAAIPWVALNYPIKKWAAVAALAGATFYLLISGAETPAVRSWIMLALMFTAILFDRPAITMRTVAIAATILLIIGPEDLLAPGFEMSFAAVTALVAFGEWEMSRERAVAPLTIGRRIWRYLSGIAVASIVAGLATAPFVIFHFDRSAQYGILSNVLSLPIAGFVIMPAAALAMVLMPFGLDAWPLQVMGWGVELMSAVAHWVAALPGATAVLPVWPVSALLAVVFGGLWIALWRERWRWLGFFPIVLGLLIAMSASRPDILIGRDGDTVAVRLPGGKLGVLPGAKDDFTADAWLKRDGDDRKPADAIAASQDGVHCDAYGCIARTAAGVTVANVFRADAFREDCAGNTIVVSSIPARRRCKGPQLVIDRFDVARSNGYAIWLGPPLKIQTVEGGRGVRPWSARPRQTQYRRIKPTSLP